MAANVERGEVEVAVGGRRFLIAVTMDGLARLSSAIGAKGLDDISNRLARNEPIAARTAIEVFACEAETGRKAAAAMKPAELFTASGAAITALLLAFETSGERGNVEAAGESG